jgi:hypothetical protein
MHRAAVVGCAVNAQRISVSFKDRLKRVGRRVQGAMGKEMERLKTLSSRPVGHQQVAVAGQDPRQRLRMGGWPRRAARAGSRPAAAQAAAGTCER